MHRKVVYLPISGQCLISIPAGRKINKVYLERVALSVFDIYSSLEISRKLEKLMGQFRDKWGSNSGDIADQKTKCYINPFQANEIGEDTTCNTK